MSIYLNPKLKSSRKLIETSVTVDTKMDMPHKTKLKINEISSTPCPFAKFIIQNKTDYMDWV